MEGVVKVDPEPNDAPPVEPAYQFTDEPNEDCALRATRLLVLQN